MPCWRCAASFPARAGAQAENMRASQAKLATVAAAATR